MLPAASQYEKWECTFFNLEFPHNEFHLRRPVFDPLPGTLPEYEIHSRLCRALGAYTDDDLAPLRSRGGRGARCVRARLRHARDGTTRARQARTGAAVRDARPHAHHARRRRRPRARPRCWGLAQRCAMTYPDSIRRAGIGARRRARSATRCSTRSSRRPRAHVHGRRLRRDHAAHRDAGWQGVTRDPGAARRVRHPVARHGRRPPPTSSRSCCRPVSVDRPPRTRSSAIRRGGRRTRTARCGCRSTTRRGSVSPTATGPASPPSGAAPIATVEVTDTLLPGHISLPNGFGLGGSSDAVGVAPNELTASDERDWFAGTPHHKHVRARLSRRAASRT